MIIDGGDYDCELNRHTATTAYFTVDIPPGVLNSPIEW